ncbi:glycosyl transferase family 2 [Aphanothece hegewaldii CCALA 016]|uniref:Glycosyl transferase family 2 n=1 Tax=Aphanothece hegewaldii CCALA 016 TaxID=2107694 RepID=A0A2T1LUB1_9CHRO|nr:glycosyltransferase [Aphanothece hegewaldii]PSF35038.1 glycosyl transferase family 2 [Aphanothece hegewaldii CCALA 016]
MQFLFIISLLSLFIWIYLILFRGGYWLSNQKLEPNSKLDDFYPSICAVIPARNEADTIPISLPSLLKQQYTGDFKIILVDDQSEDCTGEIALKISKNLNQSPRINIIQGQPLPSGWSGKLWAMEQGLNYIQSQNINAKYILFTDADIQHDLLNITQLVTKAEKEKLALVSLMVLLKCESFWERFLIPAFVYFFEKLYPFSWANNPKNKMAAAAGGCILIRRDILEKIGGIEILKTALIDDCTLASEVKKFIQNNPNMETKGIWLGLTETTFSLRDYPTLKSIWDLIARTAFTQLNYSTFLLIGTVLGMVMTYLISPISIILGIILGNQIILAIGLIIWLLMAISYYPTLKLYKRSPLWSFSLPVIAFLYTLMTIDSALRYWQGKGGGWKGRVYTFD